MAPYRIHLSSVVIGYSAQLLVVDMVAYQALGLAKALAARLETYLTACI